MRFLYSLAKHSLKELIEFLLRNFYITCNKIVSSNSNNYKVNEVSVKAINKEINKKGYYVINDFLSKTEADELKNELDYLLDNSSINIWRDELKSDNRIFFANKINNKIKKILENESITLIKKSYTGNVNKKGSLSLASKLIFKENNLGSGGGWHRDTPYSRQFKAVIYLSDVGYESGPFTYIPYSHKKINSIKAVLMRVFKGGQYRYSDEEIEAYNNLFKTQPKEITGKAGTLILTDTKGIHRGAPILKGMRYVLFNYYWDRKIPQHFNDLMQDVT